MATGGAAQFGGEGCVKGKGFAVGIADEHLLWARREGGGGYGERAGVFESDGGRLAAEGNRCASLQAATESLAPTINFA